MKKILSLLAAGALALGLIGCSGDLHDDEYRVIDLSGGAIPGNWSDPTWDNTTTWDSVDATTHTYTKTVKAAADNPEFKIVSQSGEWNVDGYTEFEVAVGGSTTATMYTGAAMGGAGNAKLTGAVGGKSYKITVVSNPDTTITISAESADVVYPTPFYLDGYFVLGPTEIGGNASWAASLDTLLTGATLVEKTGVLTYSYTFTAGAESVSFGIGQAGWNNCFNNGSTFTIGTTTENVLIGNGDSPANSGNLSIAGMTAGSKYVLKIITDSDKNVYMTVEVPLAVTVKFEISGLGTEAEGMTAVIGGNFNGWGGWTSAWGGDKKTSDIPSGVIGSDGTVEIVWTTTALAGEEVKIGEFCGYYGVEDAAGDIAEAKGSIKSGTKDEKGEYTNLKSGSFTVDEAGTWIVAAEAGGDAEDPEKAE